MQCTTRQWLHLFPQHGPGLKHERPIVLDHWQVDLVERDPRPLIRGIAWRRNGAWSISVARRDAVAALDLFVGPKT